MDQSLQVILTSRFKPQGQAVFFCFEHLGMNVTHLKFQVCTGFGNYFLNFVYSLRGDTKL